MGDTLSDYPGVRVYTYDDTMDLLAQYGYSEDETRAIVAMDVPWQWLPQLLKAGVLLPPGAVL